MSFSTDFKFVRYSLTEGLSQNTVYSVNQDKKGFIWVCTQKGANRFDGYHFSNYKNDPSDPSSLANNYLTASFSDRDKNIWLGSLNGNLSKVNQEKNCFDNFQIPAGENYSDGQSHITGICQKSDSHFFISSFGPGLSLYDKAENKFYRFEDKFFKINHDVSELTSLEYEGNGVLWAGTWNDGLIKIDLKNKTAVQFLHNPSDENSISNNRIKSIFRDSRKILWIGTADGLNRYDPDKNIFYRYLFRDFGHQNLSGIAEDKNSVLWIGSMNSGLIRFDVINDKITVINADPKNQTGLISNTVISLFSDSSNVLWIGTFSDGLNKLDCERKRFFSISDIVQEKEDLKLSVGSVLKDHNNDVLFGTDFEGLFRANHKKNELINIKLNGNSSGEGKDQTVLSLLEDSEKDIWIGTLKYGLYKFMYQTNTVENHAQSDSIYSICRFDNLNDDYLWIGTFSKGLYRFDKRSNELHNYSSLKEFNKPLSSCGIKCLLLDKSGTLWVGSNTGGLSELNFEKGSISNYLFDINDPASISDNYVLALCEDRNKNIWAGTMNQGLNLFDRENKIFKRYTTDDKLPDNSIMGILEDSEGNLWLSTNNGLSKFNAEKETVRNYDESDGLQSNEFNANAYYKDEDGVMYFGGINGLNFFKPEEINDNPYIPNIVITDFQIFNQSVKNAPGSTILKKNISETKEINLSYRESVFSFEFAALIYNNSSKNQYAYMMEGFDKEWIYSGTRRFATYTNLEHGTYTFRVKGSNNDGVWNEEGTSVKIKISPPYWKTWWFKSFGVLSIIGATGAAYRQKLLKIEKEKKSQEEFSIRQLDSQEQERKKIAMELHDTIAHDILITKNKSVIGLKNPGNEEEVKRIFNEISELASNTLNDVRSISYNLHPHQIERLGLTKAIKSVINGISNSSEIKFTTNIQNIDKILSKELEINLFRIIQECANNILKHSRAAEASLTILKDHKTLTISVWDNGKGISKNRIDGLGLTGIEERVKLYKGELVIESAESKGTLIVISLPYKNPNYENKK